MNNSKSAYILILLFHIAFSHFSFSQSLLTPESKAAYSYKDNPHYFKRMKLFATQKDQKNIVMLGDSHTERGHWVSLLGRTDVANRGIGSDVMEGFINRIQDVFDLNPIICFIEGGGNDLGRGISQHTIIKNLTTLVDTLNSRDIIPVLKTMEYVGVSYRSDDPRALNKRVKMLNRAIEALAEEKNIMLIDINAKTSDGEYLMEQFAIADGVHYTSEVYSLWKEEVLIILKNLSLEK